MEFDKARSGVPALAVAERWLDVDTYKLTSAAEDTKAFETLTLADVQRVADRLSKNPIVTVVVLPEAVSPAITNNQ